MMNSGPQLRIAIATSGRFHVLDLARELAAIGHQVKLYSYVPKDRAVAFGLPAECHRSLVSAALPYLTLARMLGDRGREARQARLSEALNKAVIKKLEPCDVFICMSGVYLEAAKHARDAFGAKIYLERGSMHVDRQNEILKAAGGRQIAERTLKRERAGYALADRITIPAWHVEESFAAYPDFAGKTFVNPYGVDLDMFPQRKGPPLHPRRVLFVGNWSYQKGVDLLVEAVRQLSDCQLIHVGALRDAPVPDEPWFTHHDPVEQRELAQFYREAAVFVLPSRQDGYGLVLLQALASGLPVVCTDQTGGRAAQMSESLSRRIGIVPAGDSAALRGAVLQSLQDAAAGKILPLADADRNLLSWQGYGQRYSDELLQAFDDVRPKPSDRMVAR